MFKSKAISRFVSTVTIFSILALSTTGCDFLGSKAKYPKHNIEYTITDQDVLNFTDNLQNMLRTKMHVSTIGAYVASFTAVAVGSAAAIYAATGGTTAAVAALAASSVFATDTLGIFKPKARARAYQGALALIGQAQGRYFVAISGNGKNGEVSNSQLTRPGANLYVQVMASLNLMEKAIVSEIPTVEDIQLATGKSLGKLNKIALSKTTVTLTPEHKEESVTTLEEGEFVVASNRPEIATAKKENGTIKITGEKSGTATVIVTNDKGNQAIINVNVKSEIAIVDELPEDIKVGKEATVSFTSDRRMDPPTVTPEGIIEKPTSTYDDKTKSGTISLKGKEPGLVIITLKNNWGAEKKFHLEVKPQFGVVEIASASKTVDGTYILDDNEDYSIKFDLDSPLMSIDLGPAGQTLIPQPTEVLADNGSTKTGDILSNGTIAYLPRSHKEDQKKGVIKLVVPQLAAPPPALAPVAITLKNESEEEKVIKLEVK